MGRSGGGHHGGGGFHGGGGHHGGGFHGGGGGFHHHHHHYHGGGGGGDICSAIVSCAVFIIIIIIIFFAFIFSVLIESSTQYVDGTLSECEQIVVCPDTLKGNIAYTSKSTGVVAVLVNSLPSISSVPETRNKEYASKYLSMDDYVYRSFNLVKGSTIHWDIRGTGTFKIILMKGYNNFKNYENLESYNYIDSDYTSWSEKSYTASYSAEYFIVVEAYYGSVTLKTINYTIDYLRYEYEGYEKKTCLSTCDFDIDSSYIPGACVIAELPCGSVGTNDVSFTYDEEHGTLYYVCLVFVIILGLAIVGSVIGCVVHTVRKKVSHGTVYGGLSGPDSSLVANTSAQPVYQTQPTSYPTQPAATSYQAQPTPYAPVPPAPVYTTPAPPYDPYGTAIVA